MRKLNLNVLHLYLVAVTVAVILLILDTYISNRLPTNSGRIVCDIIMGFCALPLFIIGAIKSLRIESSIWTSLNILAVMLIIGWTALTSLALYAFRNFQLVLPS
jgi:hypothetical protein